MITDLPVGRARLWAYLAERALADRNHILVRYENLATDPLGQLARFWMDFPWERSASLSSRAKKAVAATCSMRATMTP